MKNDGGGTLDSKDSPLGRKYILMFTMPDGRKMIASRSGNHFALATMPEMGEMAPGFLAWDDPKDISIFMKSLREKNPEKYPAILKLRPTIQPIRITEMGIFRDAGEATDKPSSPSS